MLNQNQQRAQDILHHIRATYAGRAEDFGSLGVVWYRNAEEYRALLSMFEPESAPDVSYADWLEEAEAIEAGMRKDKRKMVRAYLDPQGFTAFCRQHNLKLNSRARQIYAACYAQKADERSFIEQCERN
ncbi:MAG: hypothetical protein K2X03_07255 [Bryobacteraceae bacterium]|nr:hypothetical protein [Bryobacteraceae bacterium]